MISLVRKPLPPFLPRFPLFDLCLLRQWLSSCDGTGRGSRKLWCVCLISWSASQTRSQGIVVDFFCSRPRYQWLDSSVWPWWLDYSWLDLKPRPSPVRRVGLWRKRKNFNSKLETFRSSCLSPSRYPSVANYHISHDLSRIPPPGRPSSRRISSTAAVDEVQSGTVCIQ